MVSRGILKSAHPARSDPCMMRRFGLLRRGLTTLRSTLKGGVGSHDREESIQMAIPYFDGMGWTTERWRSGWPEDTCHITSMRWPNRQHHFGCQLMLRFRFHASFPSSHTVGRLGRSGRRPRSRPPTCYLNVQRTSL
jgi:hypothetical protein